MKRLNWDKHPILDKRLLKWEAEGYGHADIAAELTAGFGERFRRNFTEDQVRNRRRRIQRQLLGDWPVPRDQSPTPSTLVLECFGLRPPTPSRALCFL